MYETLEIFQLVCQGVGMWRSLKSLILYVVPGAGALGSVGSALVSGNLEDLTIMVHSYYEADVPRFNDNDTHSFLRCLSNMPHMKRVEFHVAHDPSFTIRTEESALLLIGAVKHNTALQFIKFSYYRGDDETLQSAIQSYRDQIEFYLKLNRSGRRFLVDPDNAPPPHNAIPLVLARFTSKEDRSVLFYFLSELKDVLFVEPSRSFQAAQPSVESPLINGRGKKRPREGDVVNVDS
jgi:hypothetical protein